MIRMAEMYIAGKFAKDDMFPERDRILKDEGFVLAGTKGANKGARSAVKKPTAQAKKAKKTEKKVEEKKEAETPEPTPPPAKKGEEVKVGKKRKQEPQAEKVDKVKIDKVKKGDKVEIDRKEKKHKVAPKADAAETRKQRTTKPWPNSILKTQPAGVAASAASKPHVRFEWHYGDFDEDVNSDIDAPGGLDHV